MRQFFDDKVSEEYLRDYITKFTGAGTGNPTKLFGKNVSFTRIGAGVYRATFAENPFRPVGVAGYALESATGTDVKGYTITTTPFATATLSIDIFVWNSAFAATDLTSVQSLAIRFAFKESGLS